MGFTPYLPTLTTHLGTLTTIYGGTLSFLSQPLQETTNWIFLVHIMFSVSQSLGRADSSLHGWHCASWHRSSCIILYHPAHPVSSSDTFTYLPWSYYSLENQDQRMKIWALNLQHCGLQHAKKDGKESSWASVGVRAQLGLHSKGKLSLTPQFLLCNQLSECQLLGS